LLCGYGFHKHFCCRSVIVVDCSFFDLSKYKDKKIIHLFCFTNEFNIFPDDDIEIL
jgi:hypothetical protein